MLKNIIKTNCKPALNHLVTLAFSLFSLSACGGEDTSDTSELPPKSEEMISMESSLGNLSPTDSCQEACHQLLDCEPISYCRLDIRQTAAAQCYAACEGEEAAEVTSDSELICDLSVPRTRERFSALSECGSGESLCSGQVCGTGFICDPRDGQCVDLCEGVTCEVGSECVNGMCQDECGGILCPEGLGCFAGNCVDLCYGVHCERGQECNASTGLCESLCQDVVCAPGLRCEAGGCIDACEGLTCPEGQLCDSEAGGCVDLCEDVTCREGFECNPRSGACQDLCERMECVEGWVCEVGSCVFDDPCADVTCGAESICDPMSGRCESFLCEPDRFEVNQRNNHFRDASGLSVRTQRIDDLTICSWDLDWYQLTIPPLTSLRVSLRFSHQVGDLELRVYDEGNTLSPRVVVNTDHDDEYLAFLPDFNERHIYLRVAATGTMFAQNRYSLVTEVDLPGALCNDHQDCLGGEECINALCGGVGDTDPGGESISPPNNP